MDPDATLKMIRELAAEVACRAVDPDAVELAELVQSLDEWISRGGFLPKEWAGAR